MTSSYGKPVNITPEDQAAGGTARQLAARARYRDPNNAPAGFNQLANQSIDAQYKLRPDSTFSQENLDSFNRRQDDARQQYGMQYGQENLQNINRYENVEDIPRYTQQQLEQQKMDRLKANPKSFYNRQNTPLNQSFDQGNQKVPEAIVNNYNSVIGKFRNLAETGDQSSIGFQDFQPLFDSLKNSPAEYIQPGENYAGPDFQNVDGSLQRLDPSSAFYQDPSKTQQAPASTGNNQGNLMGNSPSAPAQGNRFDSTAQSAQPTPPAPLPVSESAASTPTRRTSAQGNLQSSSNSVQSTENRNSAAQSAVQRANTRKSNVTPTNEQQSSTTESRGRRTSQPNIRSTTQDQSQNSGSETSESTSGDGGNSQYNWREARDRARQKRAERQERRKNRQQRRSTRSMDSNIEETEFNEEV